ncbi:MAG: Cys-tRNA(Pro) deacylase, partial [Arenicella sp.]|nr:Cys-tRNA(Pro) deacylase [Arenicella sp.]
MTPAIELLEHHNVEYQVRAYVHDAAADSYGKEAAAELGLPETLVYKTLVVELDSGELAVGVVPVASKLSTKAMARELGAKKAAMADGQKVSRVTGYVLGGVSPLGQKKQLRTLIDESATALPVIHISAGRRGLEVALAPDDLVALCDG